MTGTFLTSVSEARELLLYASLTINGSILWYFTMFICIDKGLTCILRRRASQWLRILHTCHPVFARQFYIDSVVQPVLCGLGFYLMFTTDVLENPFSGPIDKKTSIVFSVALGTYLFRSFRELFTFGKVSNFKSTIFHHVISIITYAAILDTKENGLFGVIGLVIEGGNTLIQFGKYMKKLRKRDTTFYKVNKFFGLVVAITLRGVVPVVTLAVATSTQTPFTMSQLSIAMFFISGLFIGIINFYHIEAIAESAFRQWFCDTARSRDRGNVPSSEIWQQRYNPDDLSSHLPPLPYRVTRPNVYETLNNAPNVSDHPPSDSSEGSPCKDNSVVPVEKSESDTNTTLCTSGDSAIVNLNTINELKCSVTRQQNTSTVCPNYGTCNPGNIMGVDLGSEFIDTQCLLDNNKKSEDVTHTENTGEIV